METIGNITASIAGAKALGSAVTPDFDKFTSAYWKIKKAEKNQAKMSDKKDKSDKLAEAVLFLAEEKAGVFNDLGERVSELSVSMEEKKGSKSIDSGVGESSPKVQDTINEPVSEIDEDIHSTLSGNSNILERIESNTDRFANLLEEENKAAAKQRMKDRESRRDGLSKKGKFGSMMGMGKGKGGNKDGGGIMGLLGPLLKKFGPMLAGAATALGGGVAAKNLLKTKAEKARKVKADKASQRKAKKLEKQQKSKFKADKNNKIKQSSSKKTRIKKLTTQKGVKIPKPGKIAKPSVSFKKIKDLAIKVAKKLGWKTVMAKLAQRIPAFAAGFFGGPLVGILVAIAGSILLAYDIYEVLKDLDADSDAKSSIKEPKKVQPISELNQKSPFAKMGDGLSPDKEAKMQKLIAQNTVKPSVKPSMLSVDKEAKMQELIAQNDYKNVAKDKDLKTPTLVSDKKKPLDTSVYDTKKAMTQGLKGLNQFFHSVIDKEFGGGFMGFNPINSMAHKGISQEMQQYNNTDNVSPQMLAGTREMIQDKAGSQLGPDKTKYILERFDQYAQQVKDYQLATQKRLEKVELKALSPTTGSSSGAVVVNNNTTNNNSSNSNAIITNSTAHPANVPAGIQPAF